MWMTNTVRLIGILSMIAGAITFIAAFDWEGARFQIQLAMAIGLFLGGNICVGLSRIGMLLEVHLGIRPKSHATDDPLHHLD